jgi:hypothetical protein
MLEKLNRAAAVAGAALLLTMPAHAADAPSRAAWFEGANAPAASVVRVTRGGKAVPYQAASGLQACDQLQLVDLGKVVRIVLADGGRLRLDASQPAASIACSAATIGNTLGRLFSAWNSASDTRDKAAGALSRDEGPLEAPLLFSPGGAVMAQAPQLHLVWRGGKGPFALAVRTAAGADLASQARIAGHAVALATASLPIGTYSLALSDADEVVLSEDHLQIVAASAIPPMPAALRDAPLEAYARQLFYADFLVAHEDGRYALQALQQVAALQPQTAASRSWLAAWGSGR